MKLQWDYEQAAHDFRRNLRIQIAKHPHLEKAVERIWLCVVWVLKIFVTPIPSVSRRLPKELNVSASALSLVYLVVFPIVLTQTLDYAHSTPNYTESFVFKFQIAVLVSLFVGYFGGRLGFFSFSALQTAVAIQTYYTYRMFKIPPSLETAIPLPLFLVPYVLVVITNPWIFSVLLYIFNLIMLLHWANQFRHATQLIPGPISIDLYPFYDLGLQTCTIVMSMLLYAIFQHYYDTRILHKSEKRYKSFFEENFSAVAVADKSGKIIEVNSAFAKLFNVQSALKVDSKNHRGYSIYRYIEPRYPPYNFKPHCVL